MLNSILIAVDESPAAQKAVDLAVEWARPLAASVHALYVVDPKRLCPPHPARKDSISAAQEPLWAGELRRSLESSAAQTLEEVGAKARAHDVQVIRSFSVGSPSQEIVGHGSKANLIILGRRGSPTEGNREGPGPVASYVLRRSRIPRVFIDEIAAPPKRLLVGFDGSDDASQAVSVATEIARRMHYPLTIFHANAEAQGGGLLRNLESVFGAAVDLKPEFLEITSTPFPACINYLVEKPDTLVVLGARGMHRVADWLLGTLTERLHYETRATLLVCGPSS